MTESAVAAMGAAIDRKETMETRQAGVPVVTASAPRTHWKVEEPEAGLHLVVAARTRAAHLHARGEHIDGEPPHNTASAAA